MPRAPRPAALALAAPLLSLLVACAGPRAHVRAPRVPMSDGVELAVDVLLPADAPAAPRPTVLIQTRYWRSFELKGGGPPGALPVGPREPIAEALLAAGYAVVVADVRGTGASDGVWAHPWSAAEVADAGALIDWITAQPWSDQRVGTYGLSYEGTTAILAASAGRPALKAALARQIEWDLVDEALAPGGLRNVGFIDAWDRSVAALDADGWPELFPRLPRFFVHGARRTDDDPDGARQAARVAARPRPQVAAAAAGVRGPADPFGPGGPPAGALGPAPRAAALAGSGAALGVWGSWWDGATADAVLRADAALGPGLVSAVIGPWDHEGGADQSPIGRRGDGQVYLDAVVAFFDAHLRGEAPAAPRRWWVAGPGVWREAAAWPTPRPRPLPLRGDGTLGGAPDPELRAPLPPPGASAGPDQRWTSGLLRPVPAPDRARAPGLRSFQTAVLADPIEVFGAASLSCGADGAGAAQAWLEAVEPSGAVRLLTDGVARPADGRLDLRLRPVAFALPAGWALRLSLSPPDPLIFEVPDGALTLRGEGGCALVLPEVQPLEAPGHR